VLDSEVVEPLVTLILMIHIANNILWSCFVLKTWNIIDMHTIGLFKEDGWNEPISSNQDGGEKSINLQGHSS